MKTKTDLSSTQAEEQDLIQLAMRINVEAGSIHAWIFLKKNGFRDDDIMNLLRHTPTLRLVH